LRDLVIAARRASRHFAAHTFVQPAAAAIASTRPDLVMEKMDKRINLIAF
jgi:hypothetical protein